MSEIPDDVRRAAALAVGQWADPRGELVTRVAAAILAERERCAEIVRTEEEFVGECPPHILKAMEMIGPVENARTAVSVTKKSILKRMGAA